MKAGFIGLGQMGLPMARNLLKAGHAVTVYNRTRAQADQLRPEGAVIADGAADACNGEVLISLLGDDAAIEEVILGSQNLAERLAPGAVHVCMSTISVALARRLADAHARAGNAYVSAPVFGRPDAAAAAKLFIVASGPAKSIDRCRPLFDAMGQKTYVVREDPTAATVIKLAGNFMIASAMETMGEAFALLRKSGVEPATFLEIMTSGLFAAPIYKNYGNIIANERFEPASFKAPLGLKDVRLVLAAAEGAVAPMPIAGILRDHLLTVIARHGREVDWSSLARVSAENAGL